MLSCLKKVSPLPYCLKSSNRKGLLVQGMKVPDSGPSPTFYSGPEAEALLALMRLLSITRRSLPPYVKAPILQSLSTLHLKAAIP